mgnify:FL=1
MNKDDRFSPPAVGGISLLVAFAVLCLTVFALLSLSTVQAQSRLADASLETVAQYYAADAEAVRILALLRSGESPDGVTYREGIYSYTCPISETQVLEVEVRLSEEDYEILRWQAVPDGQDGEESGFDLWDGGDL